MTSLDIGIRTIRSAFERLAEAWRWYDSIPPIRRIHGALARIPDAWRRLSRWLNSVMPKGLYARALLIIILPMVILQSVIAFVFMERHWNVVTQRLSAGVVADIAALIDVYKGYPQDADQQQIRRIAQDRLGLVVDFLPLSDMPPPGPISTSSAAAVVPPGEVTFCRSVAASSGERCSNSPEPATVSRASRAASSSGSPAAMPALVIASTSRKT